MYDKVIKAYLASFDADLRIPYLEKTTDRNDITVTASIYKSASTKQFYCLAVIIKDGEYLFEDVANHSRYYSTDEVMSKDVAQETIITITQQLLFRRRLLTFISKNPNLPSILNVAYTKTLIVYYTVQGKLRVSKLYNGELVINLPAKEQVYLSELLQEFKIRVRRPEEELPYRHGLI